MLTADVVLILRAAHPATLAHSARADSTAAATVKTASARTVSAHAVEITVSALMLRDKSALGRLSPEEDLALKDLQPSPLVEARNL